MNTCTGIESAKHAILNHETAYMRIEGYMHFGKEIALRPAIFALIVLRVLEFENELHKSMPLHYFNEVDVIDALEDIINHWED